MISRENKLLSLGFIITLILVVQCAFGQINGQNNGQVKSKPSVFVDSDEYTSKSETSAELKGHVKLIRGIEQITCDHAFIDLAKKRNSG